MNTGNWTLVCERTSKPITVGDCVFDFRGKGDVVCGGEPPYKPSSTGRVHVRKGCCYPQVFGLKWVWADKYSEKAKNFCAAAADLAATRGWHYNQQQNTLHPAVVAAFKLDDPHDWQQLLLEWPYVSKTDVTRIAYTRDERSGQDDRQTLTSLGKYLKRHWPDMADHIIRDYVAKYATESKRK